MRALGFEPRCMYIYDVAKSLGFSFGTKKRKSETKSFSLALDKKSAGFPPRTNHSLDVVHNFAANKHSNTNEN